MKMARYGPGIVGFLYLYLLSWPDLPVVLARESSENKTWWKAAAARVVITPEEAIWMAGYASQN